MPHERDDRRPLYLIGRIGGAIRISYPGGALFVQQQGKATRTYPVTRIARIVAQGDVSWEAEALLGCMKEGVPIVLVDARRRFAGWITPFQRKKGPLARNILESGHYRPWREGLDSWQQSEERRGVRGLLRRLHLAPEHIDLRPEHFWSRALHYADQGWKGNAVHYVETLKPYLMALIEQKLLEAGAPSDAVATERNHGLMQRCWHILRWDLLSAIVEGGLVPGELRAHRQAVAFFEERHAHFERRIDDLIENLEQVLDFLERFRP